MFGAKFLREWSSTLRLVNPDVMLTAEDHSGWDKVTQSTDVGGTGLRQGLVLPISIISLIGDTEQGERYAKLIKTAGFGGDGRAGDGLLRRRAGSTSGGIMGGLQRVRTTRRATLRSTKRTDRRGRQRCPADRRARGSSRRPAAGSPSAAPSFRPESPCSCSARRWGFRRIFSTTTSWIYREDFNGLARPAACRCSPSTAT